MRGQPTWPEASGSMTESPRERQKACSTFSIQRK